MNNSTSLSSGPNKLDERERKNYMKKIMDLNKINRQLSADVEMWRRKCLIVQEKYHNMNAKMAKDKFIGIGSNGGNKNNSFAVNGKSAGGWNIQQNHSFSNGQMLEEVNELI